MLSKNKKHKKLNKNFIRSIKKSTDINIGAFYILNCPLSSYIQLLHNKANVTL